MRRPRIHSSVDVLFHAGALRIARAVAFARATQAHAMLPRVEIPGGTGTGAVSVGGTTTRPKAARIIAVGTSNG